MAILRCKLCGAPLNIVEGASTAKCKYCDSVQTIPCDNNDKKVSLFERANQLRISCEFDKAYSVFESIVAEFPKEAEAYWGLVLCKYGVEYVDDPKTGKKIPTCHRSSYSSVFDDSNFKLAINYATEEARFLYYDEAELLENIRKSIIELSSKEDAYDIFICYKETAEDGNRTIDSVLAQDIYKELTKEGYKVFFSRITLEGKLGTEYEPIIFSALHSAKVMLAVGTSADYYNAVWVKNEWSRYLKLLEAGESKTLIPCYKDISPYDMPKEFARLQAQDLGKVGAIQDLLHGISKLVQPSNGLIPEIKNLLARANQLLEDEDYSKAQDYFEKVLEKDMKCGEAYLGADLARNGVKNHIDLAKHYAMTGNTLSPNLKHAKENMKEASWIAEFDDTYEKHCVIANEERKKAEEARRQAEELAKKEAEEKAKRDAEEKAKKEAEEKAKKEAEQRYIEEEIQRRLDNEKKIQDEVNRQIGARRPQEMNLSGDALKAELYNRLSRQKEIYNSGAIALSIEDSISKASSLISAGAMHSVAVMTDGTVVATGANMNGQCNVSDWKDIVAVSAGSNFTVGLKDDGTVLVVGGSSFGNQFDVSSWTDIVAISAGANHIVGLKKNGTAVATGNNMGGQCNVSVWRDIVAISTGESYSIGLKSNGTVVVAGSSMFGALNTSSWKGIISVAIGNSFALGLKLDGTVVATGSSMFGACNVNDWADIIAISAGKDFSVGVKADGTIVSAGGMSIGGQNDFSGWEDVIAVSTNTSHTVGLRNDGVVMATGSSMSGQCNVFSWKLFDDLGEI